MLVDDYFEYQQKYEKLYGKKTVVFLENGDFFELYGLDNDQEKISDLSTVCYILHLKLTRKNSKIIENSRSNPQLAGFKKIYVAKYVKMLIDYNYTVILVEQTTPPPNPKREVKRIISPATFSMEMESFSDVENDFETTPFLLGIRYTTWMYQGKKYWNAPIILFDCTTGKCAFLLHDNPFEELESVREWIIQRIESIQPYEIIWLLDEKKEVSEEEEIYNKQHPKYWLHTNHYMHQDRFVKELPTSYKKNSYQNELLKQYFSKDSSMFDPLEILGISSDDNSEVILLFVVLLQYIYEHNPNLLQKIQKPEIWSGNEYTKLYNHTLYQLHILSNHKSNHSSNNIESLMDIINQCQTPMGKRLLKHRLLHPLWNISMLEERYKGIDFFLKEEQVKNEFIKYWKYCMDMERWLRKLEMGNLMPCDLYTMYHFFKQCLVISEKMKQGKTPIPNILEIPDFKIIQECLDWMDCRYIWDETVKMIQFQSDVWFYKEGIYKEIDDLKKKQMEFHELLKNTLLKFSEWKDPKGEQWVKMDRNDRDGIYFTCTKKRWEQILTHSKKKSYEWLLEFDERRGTATTVKLISSKILTLSSTVEKIEQERKYLYKDLFLKDLNILYENWSISIRKWTQFFTECDIMTNLANISKMYHYTRPILLDRNIIGNSSLHIQNLRHPIIERIQTKVTYIGNDLSFYQDNEDKKKGVFGYCIYGINGSGKSTIMKALGSNILLAQSGCFVACDTLKFTPYEHIFTRIMGEDNIFKGHSSFAIEMLELRTILEFANQRSLVLADELCKGTEDISALSLVGSSILTFLEKKIHFMMATHLHRLMEIDEIKNHPLLKHKHLKVDFNHQEKKLLYHRILEDGSGVSLYGLEVAHFLLSSGSFLKNAENLRHMFLKNKKEICQSQTSIYSKNLYMIQCEKCHSNQEKLHTHHIEFQCTFEEENKDRFIDKDRLSNLVVLCINCHMALHQGKWKIDKWVSSNEGRTLLWSENINEKTDEKRNSQGKKIKKTIWTDEENKWLEKSTKGKTLKWIQLEFEQHFGKKLNSTMWKKWNEENSE